MTQASSTSSSPSWFQHIPKGVAVTASTGAAVASIITALHTYGVLGRSEAHQSIGNVGAAWVRLRPLADTASAIGDTVQFAATVADRKGSILVGAAPTWTTGDSTVATALPDGSVIARGPGTTTVTVVVGSLVSSAHVIVRQQVASVVLRPPTKDSMVVMLEGAQVPLQARPLDARGHVVAGRSLAWQSDDSTVARVDEHGMLVAQGAGHGVVGVKVDGASAALPVTVVMTAANLAVMAGTGQRALAGRALPQPIVVRATNRKGAPAPGKVVVFRVAGATGRIEPAAATTDADGRARTMWTLGDAPGQQQLLARVENVDSALTIAAEADPDGASTRAVSLSEGLRARAGGLLADPVSIRVTDTAGRALAGVSVRWEAGAGTVEPIAPRTDSTGVASARWTLASASGAQKLRAFVGGSDTRIAPVVIVAAALAGPAARSVVVSGGRQHAAAGQQLPEPLVLRVVDAGGNGVADAPVSLAPSGGSVPDSALTTDSLGYLRVRWTMGHSAGTATLAVRAKGVERPLEVTAHATAGRPANLSFDDAAPAAPAVSARANERRLVALVADLYGNPVSEVPVTFSVKHGAVTPARAVTDAHGRVAVRWTMGGGAGDQRLVGMVRRSDVRGAYLAQRAPAGEATTVHRGRKTAR